MCMHLNEIQRLEIFIRSNVMSMKNLQINALQIFLLKILIYR